MRSPLPVFQAPPPMRYSQRLPSSTPVTAMVASLVMRSLAAPESFSSATAIWLTCRSSVKSSVAELTLPATSICRTSRDLVPSAPNSLAAIRSPLPVFQAPPPMRYSQRLPNSTPVTAMVASLVMRSAATPESFSSATAIGSTCRSSVKSTVAELTLPALLACLTSTV